jgi:hypothetical protein
MNNTQIDQLNSKRMADFVAKQLPSKEVGAKELKLRPQLLEAARNERLSRYELGRLLDEYQKLFPRSGLAGVATALGMSRSTANRIRDGYRNAAKLDGKLREAVIKRGIDPAAPESKKLVKRLIESKGSQSHSPKVIEMVLEKSLKEEMKELLAAKVAKASKTKSAKAAKKVPKGKPASYGRAGSG